MGVFGSISQKCQENVANLSAFGVQRMINFNEKTSNLTIIRKVDSKKIITP